MGALLARHRHRAARRLEGLGSPSSAISQGVSRGDLLISMIDHMAMPLVSATPDGFRELGCSPTIEGKTWSHPALVADVLLVRNGEEMAAFRLARTAT